MNQNPLTSEQLNNAYLNLLTPQQKQMVADFGKNMYSDFTKYEAPKTTTSTPLNDEEEIEWLVRQIMSGLQLCDINAKGKKLLQKKYGKTWKSKLF
ncbi:hypothetical protein IIV6-T1_120 [Invertebrate iridescent virus 6]|nr:hypothetical protein IIV6-T1_120 [Invertebrate iridescent virus 6]